MQIYKPHNRDAYHAADGSVDDGEYRRGPHFVERLNDEEYRREPDFVEQLNDEDDYRHERRDRDAASGGAQEVWASSARSLGSLEGRLTDVEACGARDRGGAPSRPRRWSSARSVGSLEGEIGDEGFSYEPHARSSRRSKKYAKVRRPSESEECRSGGNKVPSVVSLIRKHGGGAGDGTKHQHGDRSGVSPAREKMTVFEGNRSPSGSRVGLGGADVDGGLAHIATPAVGSPRKARPRKSAGARAAEAALCMTLSVVVLTVVLCLLIPRRRQHPGGAISNSFGSIALPPHIEANLADWSEFPVEVDDERGRVRGQSYLDVEGASSNGTVAPSEAASSADVSSDVALFWTVPLSGSTVLEEIFGTCLGRVQASEVGILDGHDADVELQTVDVSGRGTYLNVDTTTLAGLERAKELGLARSDLAPDVISTSLLHEAASTLFEPSHRGRVLTVLRHPVDRAMATYRYLARGEFEGPDGENLDFASKSLEEYAGSDYADDNWVVRSLVNKPDPDQVLGPDDLDLAKAMLRRKALVGVYSDLLGALDLFVKYYDWNLPGWLDGDAMGCARVLIDDHFKTEREGFPDLVAGSDAYEKIVARNEYDVRLYEFAKELHRYEASQSGR